MTFRPLTSPQDRADALGHGSAAVIFKHSRACGSSTRALDEMRTFGRAHPDVPVFIVDVLDQRELSSGLAAELGVTHESPQVIVTHGGTATWSASHFRISAQRVAAAYVLASSTLRSTGDRRSTSA